MYDFQVIKQGVLARYPEESCGVILTSGEVRFCENTAVDKLKSFKINPSELVGYLGQIAYIFHSHCIDRRLGSILDPRTTSVKDMEGQRFTGIPWLIFATEGWEVTEPIELPRVASSNYLDRPFIWFINDCYTLVQDYYKFELGIELKPYISHDYTQVRRADKVFDEFITDYGFQEVKGLKGLKDGELFIIDNSGFSENHLAIYDKGELLHQGLVSCREPIENYMGLLRKRLRYVG